MDEVDVRKQEARRLLAEALTNATRSMGKCCRRLDQLSEAMLHTRDPVAITNSKAVETAKRTIEALQKDIGRMMV